MELPKNITQVGEADKYCKIYMEDYVISYIKQMNHLAEEQKKAVAFYGKRRTEGEISYIFCYGACMLRTLQTEVRHLSQAQQQEIEKLRFRYFPELEFCGYKLLNGEPVEGFSIYEQGICRYVSGYACFYEKNDAMLAYMLDAREEEAEPEKVDLEKFERARQRQEERRAQSGPRSRFLPWEERNREKEKNREDMREERKGDGYKETEGEEGFGSYSGMERDGDPGRYNGREEEKRQESYSGMTKEEVERYREAEEEERNLTGGFLEERKTGEEGKNSGLYSTWKERKGAQEEKKDRLKESTAGRKEKADKSRKEGRTPGLGMMRVSAAGMFAMVCVLGAATLNEYGRLDALKTAVGELLADFTEKKLPEDVLANASAGTLVTQDKLAEAISAENQTEQTKKSEEAERGGEGEKTAGENGATAMPSSEKSETGKTEGTGTEITETKGAGSEGTETKSTENKNTENGYAGEENTTGTSNGTEGLSAEGSAAADEGEVGENSSGSSTESAKTGRNNGNEGETAKTGGSSTSGEEAAKTGVGSTSGSKTASAGEEAGKAEPVQALVPISYTIQKGDTLTSISMKYYGTKDKVKDLCAYNNIQNPDDIRYGQKILIP